MQKKTLHSSQTILGKTAVALTVVLGITHATQAGDFKLNGKTFTLPDGFTIEIAAPSTLVPRPIEADFDEQGHLYVSDSSGSNEDPQKQAANGTHRVLRLTSSKSDGVYDQRTVFADHLTFPEGVLWNNNALYVAGVPSLWKLTDTTGTGVADHRAEWFSGKTITHCANDLHGPYAGPDGWIYWCKGAFAEQTYEHAGLPSRADGGQRKTLHTRAAHMFRARPDGSGIEPVMTGGMDNPIEVAFTAGGERIFTTTFLQRPGGGHRDGIIHAIYGGVYGKVNDAVEGHPRTSPDLMPVLSHLGPAACCGLLRYESGIFGADYRDNLFVTCFNLHKVTRHELTPAGATFSSRDTDFLTCDNVDFHPTDVLEDADGSLLVIDTGGWYKLCCPTSQLVKTDVLGCIYRIRKTGAVVPDDPRGLKLDWSTMSGDDLAARLDDARPAVRKRAANLLAGKGKSAVTAIMVLSATPESAQARLNLVWAATRIDDPFARVFVRASLKDKDETVRQAAAHSASVWRDAGAMPNLLELLKTGTPQNQRVAAEALGRLGDSKAVPALFAAIAAGNSADQVLQHSLTYALIEIDDATATVAGLTDASPAVRRSAMVALDQMDGGKLLAAPVAAALTSSDVALRQSAEWIASRHPEWAASFVDAMAQQWATPTHNADERQRLIAQAAALAKSPVVQDWLYAKVLDKGTSADQRQLALEAMAQARLKAAPAKWQEAIAAGLADDNADTLSAAIAAASTFPGAKDQSTDLAGALAAVGGRATLPASLRLKALSTIGTGILSVSPDLFTFIRSQLAPEQPVDVRMLAAAVIGKASLTAEQLQLVVDSVASAGPLELDTLLATFKQTNDAAIGRKLVAALKQSKAVTALRPDMLQRRLAGFGPEVQKDAEELYAKLNPDAGKMKARLDELLAAMPPGDIRRGQAVFSSAKTSCIACHAMGFVGGDVGPDLSSIGKIRTQRDLLESIVYPSASFVQSYEPVQIDITGDRLYGIIRGNTADEILLITGPNQKVHVPRKDIKQIRPGTLSLMPAGFDQTLSPQELADLIAFLQSRK